MKTPVAFLIFNRPDLTAQVFARIAEARPETLLVVADGPRSDLESERCRMARDVVAAVDWPCRVLKNYSDVNLGCRRCVSGGLDWVFSKVEEAIILEDDCLPDPSFFPFCEELLARYREDPRVGHIGGSNPHRSVSDAGYSYYFSRYCMIWGWATWRRAWREYDVQMRAWPGVRRMRRYREFFDSKTEALFFRSHWDGVFAGRIDTWDAQWLFCRLMQGTLSIIPSVNLVSNLGFRADASRTTDENHPFSLVQAEPMAFPLRHPLEKRCDSDADRRLAELAFVFERRPFARILATLGNKHFYGQQVRKIPLLGPLWARLRERRAGRSE